jgi:mycothiol synthase
MASARREEAGRLDVWAYNDSEASRALMLSLGLDATRRLLHMHRHPGEPPHLPTPDGAAIRPFRPGDDDEAWLDMNNRIFADHPENGRWTIEDLRSRLEQPWFNPDDFLVLEVDGEMAGCCWLKIEERGEDGSIGEVYVIGAAPEFQGRGLGRFLLAQGLERLSKQNVDAVAVYVDQSNERGVALYWAFEFHHHHVDVLYSLDLTPAEPAAESTSATA